VAATNRRTFCDDCRVTPTLPRPNVVVFDLGGVLIDWSPRHLYRQLIDDEDEIQPFLEEIGFVAWNAELDAGRSWPEAVEDLATRYPHRRALIEAFYARWSETLGKAIEGTVEILRELLDAGVRVVALSNWSADTYPVALERFAFLGWFEVVVISGEVGASKPDPRMFEALMARHAVDPAEAVFIDDSPANVAAAARLGFHALAFTSPDDFRAELVALGLLQAR
jgi:2-haloacid dehalogenase